MKNVLLTTTALVAFAGAAAADVSWSAGADIGYNDDIKGGMFYDANLDVTGTFDLGDGYGASISYGFDMETGTTGLQYDDYPTIEITSSFGSLKGGDLGDKGASEYFYDDRDGMALDVENHDSSSRFDVRALVEFGDFGLTVGGVDDGAGDLDGLSVGAGGTFSNFTIGFGYDEADAGLLAGVQADYDDNGDGIVNGPDAADFAAAVATASLATTAVSLGTTFGAASIGVSYADNTVDTSIGVEVGYDISADLSVAAYYADNTGDNKYGVSASYTMGALGLDAYYDSGDGATVDEMGLDVSYEIMAGLTGYAGAFDDGTTVFYVGGVYDINDNLSVTVSYAEADEISGPEFKDGTTVMLSASF